MRNEFSRVPQEIDMEQRFLVSMELKNGSFLNY